MNLKDLYNKQLFAELSEEIKWFEEEFNELFLNKSNYSKKEVLQARKMLDVLIEKIQFYDDYDLNYFLAKTLKRLKNLYPEFFNPELLVKGFKK